MSGHTVPAVYETYELTYGRQSSIEELIGEISKAQSLVKVHHDIDLCAHRVTNGMNRCKVVAQTLIAESKLSRGEPAFRQKLLCFSAQRIYAVPP